MRIAIICHNLRRAGGLSVGRNIVAELPEIAPMHQYLMVIPSECKYRDFREFDNVDVLKLPPVGLLKRLYWEHGDLRRTLCDFKPDWVWSLGNFPFPNPPCRQSLLFHNSHRLYVDISRLECSLYERFLKTIADIKLSRSLKWVGRVYCQTETMRLRFHEVLKYPLNQISICPNAFSRFVIQSQNWPAALESIRGKFILLVLTNYYPHKNLDKIIDTYVKYSEDLHGTACVLTISREQGKRAAALIDRIEKEGLRKQILCVGSISQENLGDFFYAADVMFLPTLLESFSGTYLEAMQLGVPVLTSDRDFAHEVCGEAAEYIDPGSTENIKDGILRLKVDGDKRAELVRLGLKRVDRYLKSWPEILKEVLAQEGINCV